jgi:isoleucyl-tRNA synthetase
MDPAELASRKEAGQPFELACDGETVTLEPDDLVVQYRADEGWAAVVDRDTQVAIDTRLTEELAREGMARDVVRYVQDLRKQANLEMEDRIILYLGTDADRLRQAIDAHRDYIARETLTAQWSTQPLDGEAHRTSVKVDGQQLAIALRPVSVLVVVSSLLSGGREPPEPGWFRGLTPPAQEFGEGDET